MLERLCGIEMHGDSLPCLLAPGAGKGRQRGGAQRGLGRPHALTGMGKTGLQASARHVAWSVCRRVRAPLGRPCSDEGPVSQPSRLPGDGSLKAAEKRRRGLCASRHEPVVQRGSDAAMVSRGSDRMSPHDPHSGDPLTAGWGRRAGVVLRSCPGKMHSLPMVLLSPEGLRESPK